jgi:Zn-dependent peptidase ImmA (M78 family)/transcriptional regulator with XRE-family HTH domain
VILRLTRGLTRVFVGARLQLAREFRGLTQQALGDAVAASHALISQCETGKKKAPARDLVEAFGAVLGFEPPFFYEPIADVFKEDECNFRHRRTAPEKTKTQIRAHATLIGLVIARLRLQFKFPKYNVPNIPATSDDEIESAAERCRQAWQLGVESPVLQIGRALEHAGVVIVGHVVDSKKVDAFSRYGPTAVIFLNQAIPSTSRWAFDIGHECGHLVMHRGVVTGAIETESAANRFASAFMMPRRAFGREFRAASFSWTHIFNLKQRWQASAAAVVRRAYDLGLIGAVTYRQAFKYMSAQGWARGEPHEPPFQAPELLTTALQSLGKVALTPATLCSDLHFTTATLRDVTGYQLKESSAARERVLSFRQ